MNVKRATSLVNDALLSRDKALPAIFQVKTTCVSDNKNLDAFAYNHFILLCGNGTKFIIFNVQSGALENLVFSMMLNQ